MIETPEEFKDIPEWEGYYQVSNKGRVKSLSRPVKNHVTGYVLSKELILKNTLTWDGYGYIKMQKDGHIKQGRVNRLVLMAFKGHPPTAKHVAMHDDDNPGNNNLENLSWGTVAENNKQTFDKGRMPPCAHIGKFGIKHHCSKKIIQLTKSGEEIARFDAIADAERQTGVTSIWACLRGVSHFAGGFKWKYA